MFLSTDRLGSHRRPDHEHGNIAVREHVLRLAAEQQCLYPATTMRGHHYEIEFLLYRNADNSLIRMCSRRGYGLAFDASEARFKR